MRFTVSKKLMSFVALSAVLFAAASVVSMALNSNTNRSFTTLMNQDVNTLQKTAQIQYYLSHEVSLYRSVLINDLTNNSEAKSDFQKLKQDHSNLQADVLYELQHTTDPKLKQQISSLGNAENQFASQAIQLLSSSDVNVTQLIKTSAPVLHTGVVTTNQAGTLLNNQTSDIHTKNAQQDRTVANTDLWMVIGQLILLVILVAIGWFLSRLLSIPLRRLVFVMKQVEKGNLAVEEHPIRNRDEIGEAYQSFFAMTYSLKNIIRKVLDSSSQLASASEQLSASAEQTATAAEHVSAAVQDVTNETQTQTQDIASSVSTFEEIVQGVQQISSNSQGAATHANETAQFAADGFGKVESAVEQMQAIEQSVTTLSEDIQTLASRSAQITSIVDVISDISSQTSLLALNAAIESARVGEAGRGFSVVAEEVRKLAEESDKSATQIGQLIQTIHDDMQKTSEMMKTTLREVEGGHQKVQQAGNTFEHIRSSVQVVAQKIEDISEFVQDISASTAEVNHAFKSIAAASEHESERIEQIAGATQEQLATMEEVTASSSSLAKLADELQQAVSIFTV